jgi:hypothetical protein
MHGIKCGILGRAHKLKLNRSLRIVEFSHNSEGME